MKHLWAVKNVQSMSSMIKMEIKAKKGEQNHNKLYKHVENLTATQRDFIF